MAPGPSTFVATPPVSRKRLKRPFMMAQLQQPDAGPIPLMGRHAPALPLRSEESTGAIVPVNDQP